MASTGNRIAQWGPVVNNYLQSLYVFPALGLTFNGTVSFRFVSMTCFVRFMVAVSSSSGHSSISSSCTCPSMDPCMPEAFSALAKAILARFITEAAIPWT